MQLRRGFSKIWNRPYLGRLRFPDRKREYFDLSVACTHLPQPHSAVFYKAANGQARMLHFGPDIRSDSPDDDDTFCWAQPLDLLPEQVTQICSLCDFVDGVKSSIDIDYSYTHSEDSRINGLFFVAGPGSRGITCATFVLLLFQQCGVRLLRYDEWPIRADDTQFRLHQLSSWNVSRTHIIRTEIHTPRCRPEEVVAACLFVQRPVPFEDCAKAGELVLARLRRYYHQAPKPLRSSH